MQTAKILAALGAVVMLGAILYGFLTGDFGAEGSILLGIAWGRVTLIDIYISFIVFLGWVLYREEALATRIIWCILVLALGSLTICVYVLMALQQSAGDWNRFWLGQHARQS